MRLYTPPNFAPPQHRHPAPAPAPALQTLPRCAQHYRPGTVGKLIQQIENGTLDGTASAPSPGTEGRSIGVLGRSQFPLFVSNASTPPPSRKTSSLQPAAPRSEAPPRFMKHAATGSTARGIGAVASRIERRNQTQPQTVATQPMRAEQADTPPPCRSERHPLALMKNTSSALYLPSSNGVDPLESQGMAHVSVVDGIGQGGVDNDTIPADPHSKACSAIGSDDESGWGSDFDDCDSDDDLSSEDEGPPLHSPAYFADLEKRLKAALPFLPRNRASDETMTRAFLQSRSDSDTGYASAPGTPGPDEGQLRDIVKDVREEFARLDGPALRAYDGMPDAEKQVPAPPRSPTFAEMIKQGREALKTRTHPNHPPRPTTAMDDLLNEVQNFKLEDLKPVISNAHQSNKIRLTPTDAGRKVNTTDLLRQLMEKMPDPDI